jgi:hypothetical protein
VFGGDVLLVILMFIHGAVKMQVLAYCVTAVKCPGLKRGGH